MKDSGLSEKELEQIRAVLRAVSAIEKAVLFGSRAMGLARGNSDVDIMLYGEKLTMGDVAHARALLEETTLPYQFDLVLCDAENTNLQAHLRQWGKELIGDATIPIGWDFFSIDALKADEHGSIAIGPFGSRMKSDCYVPSGVKVVRGTNLSASRYFSGEFVCITEDKAAALGSANLQPDDLVFPHRGSIGEVGLVPCDGEKYILSSSLMKLTCNRKKANPYFLFYFFTSKNGKFELLKNASQVGTPGIGQPLTSLKQINVLLPSIKEQNAIANFLSLIDDRIQLLRETNATLEAMAHALFKSWFVDFDPVHAKAEGRTPEGMDAETAALFPSEFEESELGMIPKGWKAGTLTDVCLYSKDKISITSLSLENYYSTENILPNKAGATRASGFPSLQQVVRCKDGDTLVSNIRPYFKKIYYCLEDGGCSNDVLCFSPRKSLYSLLIYLAVYDDKFFDYVVAGSTGTKMPRGDKKHILKYKIVIPDEGLLQNFTEIVEPLSKRVGVNAKTAQHLIVLRDTLLPRLISGKLRLPKFAEPTGEATA